MRAEFPFTLKLSAQGLVDPSSNVLFGVTVAEVGTATGHFAYIDATGRVMGVGGLDDAPNFNGSAKRIPLCMDEESLKTVCEAGAAAGRVKAREDHDDSVGARAGFVSNFRMQDGKAVCDTTVFPNYRNRGVFMDTASQTPELIGLSGDFKFNADVIGDRAYMRVVKIDAVDIVDTGALTHAGLFQAKSVDIPTNSNPPLSLMAKSTAPDLKAFKALCEEIAAYRAEHQETGDEIDQIMAAIAPVAVKTPAGAPAPVTGRGNPDAAVPGADPKIAAAALKTELLGELTTQFSALIATEVGKAVKSVNVEFRKEMSALGIKPGDTPAAPAPAGAAPAKEEPKGFLAIKAKLGAERNISPIEATRLAQREFPQAWNEYQVKLGIIKG